MFNVIMTEKHEKTSVCHCFDKRRFPFWFIGVKADFIPQMRLSIAGIGQQVPS